MVNVGRMAFLYTASDPLVNQASCHHVLCTARNVVQGRVPQLRRTLAADPAVRLVHHPPGFRLDEVTGDLARSGTQSVRAAFAASLRNER